MALNAVTLNELCDTEESAIALAPKSGHLDLTNTENEVPTDAQKWEELQDKILHVLSNKSCGNDFKVVYMNHKYLHETDSEQGWDEHEAEAYRLNYLLKAYDIQVTRAAVPVRQNAELTTAPEENGCTNVWKRMKNFFTLKTCRQT